MWKIIIHRQLTSGDLSFVVWVSEKAGRRIEDKYVAKSNYLT
jgi:hypothetical protein